MRHTVQDWEIVPLDPDAVPEVLTFWRGLPGLGLNGRDDSPDGLARFLDRNPGLCWTAVSDGTVVGTVLCGHDGRRAMVYHLCVAPERRGTGIARALLRRVLDGLRREGITKCQLVCFRDNEPGNRFWKEQGWMLREDLHVWQMPVFRTESPS